VAREIVVRDTAGYELVLRRRRVPLGGSRLLVPGFTKKYFMVVFLDFWIFIF
jgi:hypothetical protein